MTISRISRILIHPVRILSYPMRRAVLVFVVGSMLGWTGQPVEAQKANHTEPVSAQALDRSEISRIVSQFTARETELLEAFGRYGYQRDWNIKTVKNGKVVGEYHRISQLWITGDGQAEERILSLPMPTGTNPTTLDDLENLSAPYQFPLQSDNAKQYEFAYVGREKITNWELYVFDVKPLSVPSQSRVFHGRVWVDVVSLTIVKMLGKFEQKGIQKFPVIETFRTMIDNRFLFPTIISGDDELVFENRQSLHLRITVTFTDYVKLR